MIHCNLPLCFNILEVLEDEHRKSAPRTPQNHLLWCMWYLGSEEEEDWDDIDDNKPKATKMSQASDGITIDIPEGVSPENNKTPTPKNVSPRSRPSTPTPVQFPAVLDAEKNKYKSAFSDFLRSHSCYDIIPASGKSVVLDIDLPVKPAFHALEENGKNFQCLWCCNWDGSVCVGAHYTMRHHFRSTRV